MAKLKKRLDEAENDADHLDTEKEKLEKELQKEKAQLEEMRRKEKLEADKKQKELEEKWQRFAMKPLRNKDFCKIWLETNDGKS